MPDYLVFIDSDNPMSRKDFDCLLLSNNPESR